METLLSCHSRWSKKDICRNVAEAKGFESVSGLTLTLLSALVKGDRSGECLENTG